MTVADELYLKKFMMARAHKDNTRIEDTVLADKQYTYPNDEPDSEKDINPGKVNVEININSRLFLERNKQFKPE